MPATTTKLTTAVEEYFSDLRLSGSEQEFEASLEKPRTFARVKGAALADLSNLQKLTLDVNHLFGRIQIAAIAILVAATAAALSACTDQPQPSPTSQLPTTPPPAITQTPTPIVQRIPDPTPVPTAAHTSTPVPTATPTTTSSPTPTTIPTSTSTPTATPISAPTHTPTSSPTATRSPTLTATPTLTNTPTSTPAHKPTTVPTPTSTPTPTARESAVAHFTQTIPWFENPPDSVHFGAADVLMGLWMRDPHLGKSVAEIPWLMDGLTRDEYTNVLMLTAVSPETARLIASVYRLPWQADGEWVSSQNVELQGKRIAVDTLRTLSFTDGQTVAKLLSFPWVTSDDFSSYALGAITDILQMVQEYPDVAKKVLELPWAQDDLTRTESLGLLSILNIAWNNLDLAWHVLESPFMEPPFLQRDLYALTALDLIAISRPPRGITLPESSEYVDGGDGASLAKGNPKLLELLQNQPWFSDGLDDHDAARLHGIAHAPDNFLQALVETNYVASKTIDLPLTGETALAVVRHTPFPPDDRTLRILEEGVRIIEDFMGAPLHVGDITLLLVEPEFWTSSSPGHLITSSQGEDPSEPAYFQAIIRAVNRPTGPPILTLYHELGHYYTHLAPRWLSEGVANFLEAYIVASIGGVGLDERLAHLDSSERCAQNIWDHVNHWTSGGCDYELGEKFLLGMYAALGPDPVSAALRDLYIQSIYYHRLNDDAVYYAFLSNAPSGKEQAFRTAWLRYHGSPVIDRAHADSPDRAPLVALYNAAGGDHWIRNTNWLTDAPLGAWYGVYTNAQGRVTILDLAKNGLVGEIPPQLGELSNLIGLELNENDLTGEIPTELGDLIHLRKFNLGWNKLTGSIPPELGNLTELQSFGLNGNRLSGEIPPELAKLTNLDTFWLHINQFTGCIAAEPPEIWVEATGLQRCEP